MKRSITAVLRGRRLVQALAGGLALLGVLSLLAFPRIEAFFLAQTTQRAAATLRLAVDGLSTTIDRYKPLPALIAERPLMTQALKDPDNQGVLPFLNEQLRQTAFRIQASDVYLMDISGLTIAASSYRKELSFVGRNFGFRPYFQQAVEGGIGQFFALGTTSGERGYFIAAPVLDDARIIGVVAVKFTVDAFEEAWRSGPDEIIVTDLNGVVFMSSREDWQFRSLAPLTPEARTRIRTTRQYPLEAVQPLDTRDAAGAEAAGLLTIAGTGGATTYAMQSERIQEAGWTVSILSPTAPAFRQALMVMAGLWGVVLLAGLVTANVHQRRARTEERLAAQAAAQEMAEVQVAERTAELNAANDQLRREVEERRLTERQLRKTQADLVQAAKLAALGQMSAALSHEINQPLAAVKSYADNTLAFLDRGRTTEARENVGRISEMADRMASISKYLRNFARRPQDKLGPTPVLSVIDDAVALMSSRLRAEGARIDFDRPATELWVTGGSVRLQQVIVNLIANALDAMTGQEAPVIRIAAECDGDRLCLTVADTGPGLDEATMAQVFDPFFSTKGPHGGLGLGLSISYNIVRDFGGRLSVRNAETGGAVFTLDLARCDPATRDAAARMVAG